MILVGLVVGWLGAGDRGKTQTIRALDVLVIGPLMIAAALVKLPPALRVALIAIGAATVTFNARNFLREQTPAPA